MALKRLSIHSSEQATTRRQHPTLLRGSSGMSHVGRRTFDVLRRWIDGLDAQRKGFPWDQELRQVVRRPGFRRQDWRHLEGWTPNGRFMERCKAAGAARRRRPHFSTAGLTALGLGLALSAQSAEPLRIGMIGLDTSHVVAFTRLLNDPTDRNHVPGGRVVAAVKGGSADLESSRSRVDGYTRQLRDEFGVAIVDSIETLCGQVDAVMLESVDGRPHLEQARPVLHAQKPLFIDKPVAGSLRDAIVIYRLAAETKTPVFSASAYRFYESLTRLKQTDVGAIRGVISYGPAHLEPHHPDLFWYGVHPTEALFTILGPDCESVVRTHTPDTDVVTGLWSGGRVGTLLGLRGGATPHRVTVFGSNQVAEQQGSGDYAPLVRAIMEFFRTRISPVAPKETLAIFAFMEAADESKRLGGQPVRLREVLARHGG
jgi:hypothetical protein